MPHLDAAYNLARWLAGDEHDAQDITQEACVRAFRFVSGCRGSDGRAWLLAIVRNTAFSWIKKNRPAAVVSIDDDELAEIADQNPTAGSFHSADAGVLRAALEALPLAVSRSARAARAGRAFVQGNRRSRRGAGRHGHVAARPCATAIARRAQSEGESMNCAESRLLLHAHIDGELDVTSSLELERHLKTCAACAAGQESVQSLKTALRGSQLRFDAPDSLRRQVRLVARGSSDKTQPGLFRSLLLWRSVAFGATAVALLAILLRTGISGADQLASEAVSGHVRSLMAGHLTDVASGDQHTVKPWFDGKLDFAPDVKDFAAEGFPLVGGRLDYFDGRAVAALVYRRNKHFINVFVWPATNTGAEKTKTQTRRGYSVIYREANGLHHCLVSDLNKTELSELANLFGR